MRSPGFEPGCLFRLLELPAWQACIPKGFDVLDQAFLSVRSRRRPREHSAPVENDFEQMSAMGVHVVCGDLVQQSNVVRHNPDAIAAIAMELAIEGRKRRLAAHPN